MNFRVTSSQFAANTVRFSQARTRSLLKLQQQVSTGLRILKPSDDPGNMVTLITSHANVERVRTDLDNITIAESKLNLSVFQLSDVRAEVIEPALTIALDAPQSTERETLAAGVQGMIDLMLQIANTSDGDNALFGGTSSVSSPFEVTETDSAGRATEITYMGSSERSSIVVGAVAVDVHYAGDEVFGLRERGETIFLGDTGIAPGTGTNSATGRGQITVAHTHTEYLGDSGLQPGLSSSEDTLIGSGQLKYDADAGVISLGAGKVRFEPGDQDVRVKGVNGELLHVDTTALQGQGIIEVVGHGTLSADGGQSSVAIDFSANQIVTHAATGEVTNIDTSQVTKAGESHVEYQGTSDIFEVLIQLRDDLLNTRDLQGKDYQDALGRHIDQLEHAETQVLEIMSQQAAAADNLDNLRFSTENYMLETQIQKISEIEAVDMAKAAIQLQEEQQALEFTFAASAGLMDLSILDFLR